jgi:Bardet-Biedl syndrome 9 protein
VLMCVVADQPSFTVFVVLLPSRGTTLCLAILHPRKLSVCTLQAVGSSYLQLSKIYEHALDHTAANLAYGPFGGITGGKSAARCAGRCHSCWERLRSRVAAG